MKARFPGKCMARGDRIAVGDEIVPTHNGRRPGWAHASHAGDPDNIPIARVVDREFTAYEAAEFERGWDEAKEAAAERRAMDAEYAAGINDANRWRENRAWFGDAAADAIEFDRDMRGLNGDW